MNVIELSSKIIGGINYIMDFVFLWYGLFLITIVYPFYFIDNRIKKGKLWELIWQTTIMFLAIGTMGLLWGLPELIALKLPNFYESVNAIAQWGMIATIFRFVEIAYAVFVIMRILGREYGERRWLYSWRIHFGILFGGLLIGRWVGLLFLSLPIILAYYTYLYSLAIIILPSSNPDDRKEKWQRFLVLASYTWGIQASMLTTEGEVLPKTEVRIQGNNSLFSLLPQRGRINLRPGLVWSQAYQAVVITSDTTFNRIDGPGVFFLGKMERIQQVFDLRIQLQTKEIEVISKDGKAFTLRLFAAFRIDPEPWDRETYKKLRLMNSHLRGADKPSNTTGSFSYSNLRIQAMLIKTNKEHYIDDSKISWAEWAFNIVEDQTRKVISNKVLSELWSATDNKQHTHALDRIANELKANVILTLRAAGILLVAARIVGFHLPSDTIQDYINSTRLLSTEAKK